MRRYVLDANALLIYFGDRGGAQRVQRLFHESLRQRSPLLMSAVNWGEVIYAIWKGWGSRSANRGEKRRASPAADFAGGS